MKDVMAPSIGTGQRPVLRHFLPRMVLVVRLSYAAVVAAMRWLKRVAPRSMNGHVSRRARRRSRIARLGRPRSFPAHVDDFCVDTVADLQRPMRSWRTGACDLRRALGAQTVGSAPDRSQTGGMAGISKHVRPSYPHPPLQDHHRATASRSPVRERGGMDCLYRERGRSHFRRLAIL